MDHAIRDALPSDAVALASLIRDSFKDVAERFSLNEDNCPKHPSHCTREWIDTAIRRGVRYFLLECDGAPRGCVAIEQARPEVCYLERLAVLPEYRGRGFGAALVLHALDKAGEAGVQRVEIGIIARQEELADWYERLGFLKTGNAAFPHLPFEVAFMAMVL